MLRFNLLAAVALLAAGVTGCTHCDTCDDFPVPCVGHNTGVPVGSAPSYTMNVGSDKTTVVSNPSTSGSTSDSSAPAPSTSAGPFKPPAGTASAAASPSTLEPLPRGDAATPPSPPSLGSAKAN